MTIRSFVQGELQRQVAHKIDGTRTAQEIADDLGCTFHYVWAVARTLGLQGKLPAPQAKPKPVHIKVGLDLTPEVARWLQDNTPKGGTLADLVRGIVVDAHAEAGVSA